MTPHRSSTGRGSLIIDRQFGSLGRIRKASGTNDRAVFKQVDAMLTALYTQGRHDVLVGIRDGSLALRDAFAAWRVHGLDKLPTADVLPSLAGRWTQWANEAEASDEHRRSRRQSLKALRAPADARLLDLPLLVRGAMRTAARGMAVKVKANALAFARDVLTTNHWIYRELTAVQAPKAGPRVLRPFHTPDQARALVHALEVAGPIWWTMCATGMGQKEYWIDGWQVLADRVAIGGVKRPGRERIVPLFTALTPPPCSLATLRRRLHEVAPQLQIRDARRAFSRWMEEAGIPRTRRKLYMGHGAGDVTALYERYQVDGFIAEDAAALSGYVGGAMKPVLKVASGAR